MKKTGVTLIVLMILTLLIAPFQSAMASSAISVKLSNYIGNKTSMDISTTGEYKLSGSNVAVTKRYDGKNRYEVANSIASAGWKNPSTVVIVSRDAFDHAISVSPLAYKLGAPILYTNIEKLTKTTENQLKKMKPDNILIVGNTKSISTAAEKSIKKYGKVRRISGKDKFEISQKIAKEMGNYKQAVVVGGNSFMNGIAIASYASRKGYPILLTKKDSIPSYRMPSKVIIIGSTKSTGQKVENQIKKTSQVTRISGANRYELSVNIIKKLNINADKVYLAKASSYIYAMPLSQLAAKSNSTVVYVKPDSVTASLKALLKGDVITSILYHPLILYVVFVAVLFAFSYLIYAKTKNPKFRLHFDNKYAYIGIGIIVINFVIKNVAKN